MNRLKTLGVGLSLLAGLTLLLAACSSGAPSTPSYTQSDTSSALNATQTDVSNVASAAVQNDSTSALQGVSILSVPTTTGHLPRGDYTWNASTSAWVKTADNPKLILRWSFTPSGSPPKSAVLTIDWEVNGVPTVTVNTGSSSQEVPKDTEAVLLIDGTPSGKLDVQTTWQSTSCGLILEPATLSASGYLGGSAKKVTLSSLKVVIPLTSGAISSSGKASATDGTASASIDWNLSLQGTVTRSSSCQLSSFSITGGHIALSLNTPSHDLSFAVDFSNLVYSSGGGLQSVDFANGKLSIDNALAVTFQGKMDDSNSDGTPGENVILTFKDGQTTNLEAFINASGTPGTPGLAALGNLMLPLLK